MRNASYHMPSTPFPHADPLPYSTMPSRPFLRHLLDGCICRIGCGYSGGVRFCCSWAT